jgi:hypothetical protein
VERRSGGDIVHQRDRTMQPRREIQIGNDRWKKVTQKNIFQIKNRQLMEHYKAYLHDYSAGHSLLHIEQKPGEQMNLKLKGDPVMIAKMVSTAMRYNQEICAMMIAPVIEWCTENDVDCGELKEMIKFH